MVVEKFLKVSAFIKSDLAKTCYPEKIHILAEINKMKADTDIIIISYKNYKLTNLIIENYLKFEQNINIIVVEGSGHPNFFKNIMQGNNISRILVDDISLSLPQDDKFGSASFGMSLSAAVGYYFSESEYLFFSHNDMCAMRHGFIDFLKSKMSDDVRIASFAQRHFLPFSGCMLIKRTAIRESGVDWMVKHENEYLKKSKKLAKLYELKKLSSNPSFFEGMESVDSGESYIYEEILKDNKVYVVSSVGGDDYWKSPFDYFGLDEAVLKKKVHGTKALPFIYAPLNASKEEFEQKFSFVLSASRSVQIDGEKINRKYWKYSFDDDGNLMFIHHGKGTIGAAIVKWMKMIKKINKKYNDS